MSLLLLKIAKHTSTFVLILKRQGMMRVMSMQREILWNMLVGIAVCRVQLVLCVVTFKLACFFFPVYVWHCYQLLIHFTGPVDCHSEDVQLPELLLINISLFLIFIMTDLLLVNIQTAEGLASQVTEDEFTKGLIYPPYSCIRKISANIAATVADKAYKLGKLIICCIMKLLSK